MQEAVSIMPT